MILNKEEISYSLEVNNAKNIIKGLILEGDNENKEILHMTANENILSLTASMAMKSSLSNRYHIGTKENYENSNIAQKSSLIFKGLPNLYKLEAMAHDAINKNLGGEASDTRLLSGMHAMICTISSLTNVGDTILSICPNGGGHFATGNLIRQLGRKSIFVKHDPKELILSLSDLLKIRKEHKNIKMAILDDSSPLFIMPFSEIRNILGDEVLIVYDASHTLGLIYGKTMDNPILKGIDIIQANTHKTFPGPQKGIIHFAKESLSKTAIDIIGNALVSSQHTHHSLALYVTILEMDCFAKAYASTMLENASIFANELTKFGLELLNNGKSYTETNQVLLKIPKGMGNREAFERILKTGISVNVKNVYFENVIRIGIQELTRRGMRAEEMKVLAKIISAALLKDSDSALAIDTVKNMNKQFDQIFFSFDDEIL